MDPIIVIVKEIKNGKICLTEDELKGIIRQAYNDGYTEGKKTYWYNQVITSPTPPPITWTSKTNTPLTDPYINITCEANNTIGD